MSVEECGCFKGLTKDNRGCCRPKGHEGDCTPYHDRNPFEWQVAIDAQSNHVTEVLLLIRVKVSNAQLDKFNAKRVRLGRQTRTAEEEVVNHVAEALQHNLMFEDVWTKEVK